MNERYRVLALMTSAQAGASIVQQAVGVLAPFFILQFAVNDAQLGSMFTALYIGSAVFTAVSGVFTDRYGERTMVAVSGALMTIALLLAAAVANYTWVVACMFLYGAGYAASTPAGGRAILAWFEKDRGFAMGIRQTGVPAGGLAGAVVLPFVAASFGGYRAALVVAAALVAIPTILACVTYREAPIARPPSTTLRAVIGGMRRLARDPRLIAVTLTCMALGNAQLAMNGFLTVTSIQIVGVSHALAAVAMAAAYGAATFARIFWGWFSDRFMRNDRPSLVGVLCACSAISAFVISILNPALAWLLIPASAALGFFGAGWNGVMAATLAEIGGADRAGSALGLTLTAIFGASAVWPLLFGTIADHTTLDTSWRVTAIIGVIGVAPILWLRSLERRKQAQ